MSTRGRRIAFDYGDTRIGVAMCDPDGILATPLPFLRNSASLKRELIDLFAEHAPIAVYLGHPKTLAGDDGIAVSKVEVFSELLKTVTDVPLIYVDERLSTVDASRKLRESGKDARTQRELIDSMAAVGILEAGLARE